MGRAVLVAALSAELARGAVGAVRDDLANVGEAQDAPERRGAGVGTALTREAERLVAAHGHDRLSLSVGVGNPRARALYERLGYEPADHPPKHIRGTILLRSGPLEVDDTLLYYVKRGLSRDLSLEDSAAQGHDSLDRVPQ
jgi:RimJ/RimL family protein N-acetyltransferase